MTANPFRNNGTGWETPIPLGDTGPLPEYPIHTHPTWIADQATQVAQELQLPVDLPAMIAITALSICAQGHADINIQGTWTEPLNTYTITSMPPSAGKSPAFKAMLKPINDYEQHLIDEATPERDRTDTLRKILIKQQSQAISKGETAQALTLGDELRELPEIAIPRLMADDITPEKIPPMLEEQGGKLALVSTEGGVFGMMTGRYSDTANLDVYLKSWSGDTIRVDRVGRPDSVVKHPAITVGVTVQPHIIRALAETPELRGRGLTARFMFSLPTDYVGRRNMKRISTWNPRISDHYHTEMTSLARTTSQQQRHLTLNDEARHLFLDWRQSHEQRLTPAGDLRPMAEWVTKLQSTVTRLAALLHLANRQEHDQVGPQTMQHAIEVGDYWEAHAAAAHQEWGTDPVLRSARSILDWLVKEQPEMFTIRDTYRACRKTIERADDAVEPLTLLVDNGWIKTINDHPIAVGRRGKESVGFVPHPDITTLRPPVDHSTSTNLAPCPESLNNQKEVILSLSEFSGKYQDARTQGHGANSIDTERSNDHNPPVDNSTPNHDPF
jgi:hypothetical protein